MAPALLWLGRLVLGIVIAAAVWEGAVLALGIRPEYLPRLSAILSTIVATPEAYVAGFLRTLLETLIGFAAGVAVGVLNGILFLRAPVLRDMLFPIFVVFQTVPVIAFGALVVLWFGNTLLAKAVIAFYLTFFPVTVNTLLGLRSVDPRQIALLRSFGATGRQLLLRLMLPAALPQIFVALRLGASLSLVGAIVGE
ncbi:ABC transporter permease [Roseomonas sp. KE2513]|uniref:ABC transporter permease n=1 Tax=Roseomonas sp. KE2513 TaxID=2479202 RepID=UPI0018DF0B72|nr:ABC transporter permease subunit [Roseomonas sp. KE2513]